MLAHPVINALVASAEQAEPLSDREFVGHRLIESASAGAEEKQWTKRLGGLHGGEDRLSFHHHSCATTERCIVDRAVDVGGVLAQVVTTEIEQSDSTWALPRSPSEQKLSTMVGKMVNTSICTMCKPTRR